MIIKSKKELENQISFYKFLKNRNSSIEGHFNLIELEDLEGLTDDAWKILTECGNTTLKLYSCNGLANEILEKLKINNDMVYRFVDEPKKTTYTIDDLYKIYNVLETFKCITDNAENNIHKIIMVCNIVTWLVWPNNKTDEYATEENIINSRSLKGCLFEGRAVCNGYALAIKIILNYIGIDTTLVGGYGISEYHAWNQVKDEIFYNLDLTFDWQAFLLDLPLDNTLKSDEQFYTNHNINVSWEDYTQLKKCPKSISNNDLRYYSKMIPEDLKKFLIANQSKGLNVLSQYNKEFSDTYNISHRKK